MQKEKLQIGDIFEFSTKEGLRYGQYTHPSVYTEITRIFKTCYRERPADISLIANDLVEFTVIFILKASVLGGIVQIVGNAPVRKDLEKFPIFKSGLINKDGIIETWYTWDGENECRVFGDLSEEQKKYPRRGTLNLAALQDLVEGRMKHFV